MYRAVSYSVLLSSGVMEQGAQRGKCLVAADGWGSSLSRNFWHTWDQRFQTCIEAGRFNLISVQPGLDPAPLGTFE